MKWRVVELEWRGEKVYRVQYRRFLFWRYYKAKGTKLQNWFTSEKLAIAVLEMLKSAYCAKSQVFNPRVKESKK